MSAPFRFLHASDFHLDRPPRGLVEVPDHLRAALVDAPYRAAERVFDAALQERVDFVVLSGDLVDPVLAGPRGLVFLDEQFERMAQRGVGVYWALGRSDRLGPWSEAWPLARGVVRFADNHVERVVHCRGEEPLALVVGTSAAERKRIRLSQFETHDPGLFVVATAHGAADADALARLGVDYWALGGEHDRRAVLTGEVVAHYCGSPQGRRPQETGSHGCTLVQVDEERRIRTSFIPTDAVRYLSERVAVNETTTPDQLRQIIDERVAELATDPFGPDLLIEWNVAGSKALSAELRRGKLAADLVARLRSDHALRKPAVWSIAIAGEAPCAVPPESYEEQSLLGEFLRRLQYYVDHPDEPLDFEPYLPARLAAGSMATTVSLDEPAQRRRILDEAARLGVELLSPQEPRP
ncbi:MAG: metallophosphoesterase [Pirellulales bacterium]